MSLSPRHALAVWKRSAHMYRRTWMRNLLPNFFEPVFYLMSIGIGVGAYVTKMEGLSYIDFLAPGLVMVAAMNGASFEVTYNVFVKMNYEKAYDAMLTAPLTPTDILFGEALWSTTRATIYGGCFFLVAVCFGLVPLPGGLWALAMVPLTGALFASIGLAFTMTIRIIDLFSFYFTLFLTPLFLFSGVFFPLEERLSGGWLWVAEVLPLLHPVRLARASFHGELGWVHLWDLSYCLGVTAALLAFANHMIKKRLTI